MAVKNKLEDELKHLQDALAYLGHEHLARDVRKLSLEARRELLQLNAHRMHTVKQKLERGNKP